MSPGTGRTNRLSSSIDGLQVGVAKDVIPLFGGQTREFAGA